MNSDLQKTMGAVGTVMMDAVAMGNSYNWVDMYALDEIRGRYASIKEQLKEMLGVITEVPAEDLMALGFSQWDEEKGIYLVPLWVYDLVEDGTELTSINGKKLIKGKDVIDLDVRLGCIAYGIKVKQ